MFFEKVHEVGNRSRWKTRQTVSEPSMKLIADEIEALKGITGLYANARTGTIIVTVEDLEARATLDQYFVYLQTHAPIYRLDPSHKIAAFQESKSKPKTPSKSCYHWAADQSPSGKACRLCAQNAAHAPDIAHSPIHRATGSNATRQVQ